MAWERCCATRLESTGGGGGAPATTGAATMNVRVVTVIATRTATPRSAAMTAVPMVLRFIIAPDVVDAAASFTGICASPRQLRPSRSARPALPGGGRPAAGTDKHRRESRK